MYPFNYSKHKLFKKSLSARQLKINEDGNCIFMLNIINYLVKIKENNRLKKDKEEDKNFDLKKQNPILIVNKN